MMKPVIISVKHRFTKAEVAERVKWSIDENDDRNVGLKRVTKAIKRSHIVEFGKVWISAADEHGVDTDRFYDAVQPTVDKIAEEIAHKLFPE